MKKEITLAIVMGFILGLIITFGLWRANRALQENGLPDASPTPSPISDQTPTITPPENQELKLEIKQPANNLISSQPEISLQGETAPKAILAVFSEEGEKIITADDQGLFETKIELNGGVNQIQIKAFDELGHEAEAQLEIIYSTAKI